MMKHLSQLTLAGLALAFLPHAAAQETRTIRFRTLCLEQAQGISAVTLPGAKPGDAAVVAPLYTGSLSPVIEASFTGTQAAFGGKDAAAGKPPSVTARVTLANSARQLFLFIPALPGSAEAYRVLAFDDDETSFKPGQVRAINLAPAAVRFTLGGVAANPLPSGRSAILQPGPKKDTYNMYQSLVEFQGAENRWTKAYSANWKAAGTRREIVITLVDRQFKQPSVKCYADIPPWLTQP